MSECEIIVKMDKHLKLKGGHYVQDLVRCEDCKFYYNGRTQCLIHDSTGYRPDDFCSYGERTDA